MTAPAELQVYVRNGLVIVAIAKPGCLAMPIRYLTPDEADKFADKASVTIKEMAEAARRSGETVHKLKTGA